ncbi:NADH dehydrogenase subunit 2 [Turnera subulata]|uniref:NADH dehydrogenase subunit 2 n=1 Tax=Turnera subulata TaxID=218843 RepID=A0A9Q0FCU1_9ROSI|nr:NADH dehydrogenase subunit 2 [Turnera subulata]
MIYGSTGATHFDQLAKIFTGNEIAGARSSGIFLGILFIAVGFLFNFTKRLSRLADSALFAHFQNQNH